MIVKLPQYGFILQHYKFLFYAANYFSMQRNKKTRGKDFIHYIVNKVNIFKDRDE